MNTIENDRLVGKIQQHESAADELSEMVLEVLATWFTPPEYEVQRDNPICWRVRECLSAKTIVALVLEDLEDGSFAFTVGGDWTTRPSTRDTSRDGLFELLQSTFLF